MKKKSIRLILLFLILLYAIANILTPGREESVYAEEMEFVQFQKVDQVAAQILRSACYDCHSYETVYPWYAEIIPVRWIIDEHVNDGRRHLNFSDWGLAPREDRRHMMKESIEYVEKGEMPLKGYVVLHPEADLDNEKKEVLLVLFRNAMK